ncbi:MAG: hypothetical protein AVDCRST_MAG03-3524, partial [uncultured Rubrobacteraceae bacterium]
GGLGPAAGRGRPAPLGGRPWTRARGRRGKVGRAGNRGNVLARRVLARRRRPAQDLGRSQGLRQGRGPETQPGLARHTPPGGRGRRRRGGLDPSRLRGRGRTEPRGVLAARRVGPGTRRPRIPLGSSHPLAAATGFRRKRGRVVRGQRTAL